MLYRMAVEVLTSFQNQWTAFDTTTAPFAARVKVSPQQQLDDAVDQILGEIEDTLDVINQHGSLTTMLNTLDQHLSQVTVTRDSILAALKNPAFDPKPEEESAFEDALGLLASIQAFIDNTRGEIAEVRTQPAGNEGSASSLRGIRGAVEDISSFPLLTASDSTTGISSPLSASASVGNQIEIAMREVLGGIPRNGDMKALVSALQSSFSVTEVEGHTEVRWLERSFAGSSTLAGRLSGAQLSLLNRAKDLVSRALSLLGGFRPLLAAYDPEEVDAIRAINENELNAILTELGREGGPLVSKVDTLFESLIGSGAAAAGHVADLGDRFGLDDENVITLDEEFDATNFLTYEDIIIDLRDSWRRYSNTATDDLGTTFLLLDRTLSVARTTVYEAMRAMDSVYFEEAARQVSYFTFNGRRVVVQDFLTWISDFCGRQAPDLLFKGGRRGAQAIILSAERIGAELNGFISALGSDPGLPPAAAHPRVRRPLDELKTYIARTLQLAKDVSPGVALDPIEKVLAAASR